MTPSRHPFTAPLPTRDFRKAGSWWLGKSHVLSSGLQIQTPPVTE